jgi:hypothetical protein
MGAGSDVLDLVRTTYGQPETFLATLLSLTRPLSSVLSPGVSSSRESPFPASDRDQLCPADGENQPCLSFSAECLPPPCSSSSSFLFQALQVLQRPHATYLVFAALLPFPFVFYLASPRPTSETEQDRRRSRPSPLWQALLDFPPGRTSSRTRSNEFLRWLCPRRAPVQPSSTSDLCCGREAEAEAGPERREGCSLEEREEAKSAEDVRLERERQRHGVERAGKLSRAGAGESAFPPCFISHL